MKEIHQTLTKSNVLVFAYMTRAKPRKNSDKTVGVTAEVIPGHSQKTCHKPDPTSSR